MNPFNLTNPWRILRFLLPFTLVLGLGLQHANEIGLEEWWQNVSYRAGGVERPMMGLRLVAPCFIILVVGFPNHQFFKGVLGVTLVKFISYPGSTAIAA